MNEAPETGTETDTETGTEIPPRTGNANDRLAP